MGERRSSTAAHAVLKTLACVALVSVAMAGHLGAARAYGAAPARLWRGCVGGFGAQGAGECDIPRGIAADPVTGRLYVVDQANDRIDEFTAWGQFVRAWGWGVESGTKELQTCTAVTGCRAGIAGDGAGQLNGPQGIAIDDQGDVYVVDLLNSRVEKFDPSAGPNGGEVEFLLSFGSAGTEPGQFSWHSADGSSIVSSFIGIGNGDKVYVGDHERVEVFDSEGNHLESISLPGRDVSSLAVGPEGALYLAFCGSRSCFVNTPREPFVMKLSAAGSEECRAAVADPTALAVDSSGEFYVVQGVESAGQEVTIRKFAPDCEEDATYAFSDGFSGSTGLATNTVTEAGGVALYVANSSTRPSSYVQAYFPAPDLPPPFDQPPPRPPVIGSQYGVSASAESATVRARINPRFWKDTSFYVEYGTAPCFEGGCQSRRPLSGSIALGAGVADELVTSPNVFLDGLAPATTYHFRFVAESGGGGPVYGVDPDGAGPGEASFAAGTEATFTTFPATAPPSEHCPNAALRIGASARLPDCRAYEMVSPIDKSGGDIEALEGLPFSHTLGGFGIYFPASLSQAAPGGDRVTYSAARAFAGAVSAPWTSQYMAERDPQAGWVTRSLNPPLGDVDLVGQRNQETPFTSFSEDLCSVWFVQDSNRTLTSGAPQEVPNLYRRDNCSPSASYELLTTVAPPGYGLASEPEGSEYAPEIQGYTDGGCSLFRTNAALTPDAHPVKGPFQLYEKCPGEALRLVSVLPSGVAAEANSSLGTATSFPVGNFRDDSVSDAVVAGGERLFWTAGPAGGTGTGIEPGQIYLRASPTQQQSGSGACDEAGKACTLQISGPNSAFLTADPSGSRVIYRTGSPGSLDELYEARIEDSGGSLSSNSTLIAKGVEGILGASTDATRVYLVSTEELTPDAAGGRPNLYFYEREAGFKLVATLTKSDVEGLGTGTEPISPSNLRASFRTSRISADGLSAAFMSQGNLTGYDNSDVDSGLPDYEVFLYDAAASGGAGQLLCVSCNPTGVRPAGVPIEERRGKEVIWAAAQLPGWTDQLHPSRLLSASGQRLFFESYDGLVPADRNGVKDVYEWERASGAAQCEAMGAALYVHAADGCISLISSGASGQSSDFVDASSDGSDVFFTTGQSLVPDDPGLIDLYDARVEGGFSPRQGAVACEGETCQSTAPEPGFQTSASETFSGSGNVRPTSGARPHCRSGKVRRRGRCVRRPHRHRHHHRRTHHRRRHGGRRHRGRRAGR